MASDWKERLGVVFSTNPDFKYETSTNEETTTLEPSKQNLKIWLDRLKGGRVATVIRAMSPTTAIGTLRSSGLLIISTEAKKQF